MNEASEPKRLSKYSNKIDIPFDAAVERLVTYRPPSPATPKRKKAAKKKPPRKQA